MSLLFSSFHLGGLQLRNRLVVSPMCQYSAVDGVAQAWHTIHVGTLAVSGAGLVIMEATAVEAIGRTSREHLGLYSAQQEHSLHDLVRQVRSISNCAIGIQLSHAGRKASCPPGWEPQRQIHVSEGGWLPVAPSPAAFGPGWVEPLELDDAGLTRVRDAFVEATQRADRCGFDLIELHAAHGYLLSSFLSPLGNFRTDRYGGSRENRMAYPLEVVRAVRAAWPRQKALGIRINADELDERGTSLGDAVEFAREFTRAGADYVTLSAGNAVPSRPYPPIAPGYQVGYSHRVRAEAGVTTMAVGMILQPRQAEAILQSGQADLIAIARGFIDNPRWGWHAANELGDGDVYPLQYRRARPERWPGYALLHEVQSRDTNDKSPQGLLPTETETRRIP